MALLSRPLAARRLWRAVLRAHAFLPLTLREDLPKDMAMHVGQPPVAAIVAEGEALVIDAEQVQHRRMQVVAGQRRDGPPTPFVTLANADTAADTGAREPRHARAAVVVASL